MIDHRAVTGRRIILVGELNPYGSDPDFALYPKPDHASGGRLARILGLKNSEYVERHDRVNLCTGTWNAHVAATHALVIHVAAEGRGVILLGTKVVTAFERAAAYPAGSFPLYSVHEDGGRFYLALPHPSGRNRVWNDPGAADRARAAYEDLWARVPKTEHP